MECHIALDAYGDRCKVLTKFVLTSISIQTALYEIKAATRLLPIDEAAAVELGASSIS
jgi:hypothetical protein